MPVFSLVFALLFNCSRIVCFVSWEDGVSFGYLLLRDISACSMLFQTSLVKDAAVYVNRCIWGPDGSILGVVFSKHIVQLYAYNPSGELRHHLEIDAHVGSVNDIAFAHPNKQLCIVTCGDDKN